MSVIMEKMFQSEGEFANVEEIEVRGLVIIKWRTHLQVFDFSTTSRLPRAAHRMSEPLGSVKYSA